MEARTRAVRPLIVKTRNSDLGEHHFGNSFRNDSLPTAAFVHLMELRFRFITKYREETSIRESLETLEQVSGKGAMVKGTDQPRGRTTIGILRRRIVAVAAIFLFSSLLTRAESPGPRLNPVSDAAVQVASVQVLETSLETSQTVLVWFPNTGVVLDSKAGVGAAILFAFLMFFVMGYTWQALDEEEFPDSELPRWFVSAFRRREGGFLAGQS